ncbi:MAG: hypothetical protein IPJ86_02960 [Bacteroidetes bacterium]|nr:hypothetical protein [Bacteroidota bacterium]
MDLTHLHLLLNHFPIIGTIIGIALMVYALLCKQRIIQNAVLAIWVAMAIITIPVMKTGEEAEETVENIAGITEASIHAHEEAAELALWLMITLGIVSLAGLLLKNKDANKASLFTKPAFVLSLVVFAAMARTGYLGGQIRHTELQGITSAIPAGEYNSSPAPGETPASSSEDDD